MASLTEPFGTQPTLPQLSCTDQGISLCANTNWSYNLIRPQSLQVQKWASGTRCSWLTLSFAALPSADKIPASFGWISHSLSRGVKAYVRPLSYVSLDSCSAVVVQSWVEERNLEKMQQGAHTCTAATPGLRLESHRDGWFCTQRNSSLAPNFSIQMFLSALRTGTMTFRWAFGSCVCEYLEKKGSQTCLGLQEATVTKWKPTFTEQTSSSRMVLVGGHSPHARFCPWLRAH